MGLIREPEGVDLVVWPSILTEQDKQMISDIIANYKRTRKLPVKPDKTRFRGWRKAHLIGTSFNRFKGNC